MRKILKPSEVPPHTLTPYEREVLEGAASGGPGRQGQAVTPEMILNEARAEAARKIKEAYAEGSRRGTEAGKAEFEKSVGQSAEALRAAAEAMKQAHAAFLESLEPEVVELVQTITAAVVQREARTDPELIHATVRRALGAILDRENLIVHVNPAELEALRAHKVTLLEDFDGVKHLDVQPDESVSPGGCFVESEVMSVDARLESQLERIFDALKDTPEFTMPPPAENADQLEG